MELRQLGGSDLRVSPVIFGAWAIGGWLWGGSDERDAIAAIQVALDSGVNTIDTAAIYGMGHSEELVGRAIRGRRRDQVIVATKCGNRWDSEEGSGAWTTTDNQGRQVMVRRNGRASSILWECEQSLRRLGVDVIDLYQVHRPDVSTPVEETMGALVKLQEQGKIRAIGVSNYDVAWLSGALKAAPVASLQPPYSLIQRQIEKDLLPFCRERGVGVIVYSPMERGLLTGKVGPERTFAAGDHRAGHEFFTVENRKRVQEALERIRPIADRHNASFAQVVINWTFSQRGITAAIVGARDAEQARHNAGAMGFVLSPQELAEIRQAFDEPSRVMTA